MLTRVSLVVMLRFLSGVGDEKAFDTAVKQTTIAGTLRVLANMRKVAREYVEKEPLESQFPALHSGRLDTYTAQSVAEVSRDHDIESFCTRPSLS